MSSEVSVAVSNARQKVVILFTGGVVLAIGGALGSSVSRPRLVLDDAGTPVDQGSPVAAGFCQGMLLIGLLLAFIAVVAWGVRLGLESAARPSDKGGPTHSAKRVWSEEHQRFVDEPSTRPPTQGGTTTT